MPLQPTRTSPRYARAFREVWGISTPSNDNSTSRHISSECVVIRGRASLQDMACPQDAAGVSDVYIKAPRHVRDPTLGGGPRKYNSHGPTFDKSRIQNTQLSQRGIDIYPIHNAYLDRAYDPRKHYDRRATLGIFHTPLLTSLKRCDSSSRNVCMGPGYKRDENETIYVIAGTSATPLPSDIEHPPYLKQTHTHLLRQGPM